MDVVEIIRAFGIAGGLAIIIVVSFAAIARQWARAQAVVSTATGNAKASAIQADAESQVTVNQIALKALEDKRVADDRFTDLMHESNHEIRVLGEKLAAFSAVDHHRNALLERQTKQLEEYEKLTSDMWAKYNAQVDRNQDCGDRLSEAERRLRHLEAENERSTKEVAQVGSNPEDTTSDGDAD